MKKPTMSPFLMISSNKILFALSCAQLNANSSDKQLIRATSQQCTYVTILYTTVTWNEPSFHNTVFYNL